MATRKIIIPELSQKIKLKKEIAAFDKNIEKTQGEVDTLNRALKITESTTAEEKK